MISRHDPVGQPSLSSWMGTAVHAALAEVEPADAIEEAEGRPAAESAP